jgi:uncharacterized membrane protein|tara:strand:- start:367 stop:867 length:501 start_codon:yes stop_codon:yes gene_type:complete
MKISNDRVLAKLLNKKISALSTQEKEVVDSVVESNAIVQDVNELFNEESSFGNRLSDKIAAFGGSWTFIIVFFLVVCGWMLVNTYWLRSTAFDPYPFILLNLFLSSLAAFQAPIIMMTQSRQSEKDRIESSENFKVSLKSDLEIMAIHQKIDEILARLDQKGNEPV